METESNSDPQLFNYGTHTVFSEFSPFYDFFGDTKYIIYRRLLKCTMVRYGWKVVDSIRAQLFISVCHLAPMRKTSNPPSLNLRRDFADLYYY